MVLYIRSFNSRNPAVLKGRLGRTVEAYSPDHSMGYRTVLCLLPLATHPADLPGSMLRPTPCRAEAPVYVRCILRWGFFAPTRDDEGVIGF